MQLNRITTGTFSFEKVAQVLDTPERNGLSLN
jgi:hypothetical protein